MNDKRQNHTGSKEKEDVLKAPRPPQPNKPRERESEINAPRTATKRVNRKTRMRVLKMIRNF